MTVQGTRPSVASGFSLHGFVNNVPLKLLATIFLDEASPHSKVSNTFLSHFPRAFLQKRSSGRQRNKYNLHLDLIGPYKVGFSWNFDEDEDNVLPVGTDLVLGQDFLNLPNIQFFPHERYLKLNNSIINFAGNLLDTFWVKQHMETAFPYITTFTSNDENVGLKTCIAFSAEKNFISFDCLGKLPFYRAGRERYNGLYQYKFPLFIKDDKGLLQMIFIEAFAISNIRCDILLGHSMQRHFFSRPYNNIDNYNVLYFQKLSKPTQLLVSWERENPMMFF